MDFGHGFLPRIDKRNWTGVDRALGPAGRLPLGDGVDLPWAVVDHAYACARPSMREALTAHDVRLIVDASAWRYRETATFAVDSMTAAPYAPSEPIDGRGDALRHLVESDLRSQCEMGAAAYLIPGFVPRNRDDSVDDLILDAIDIALGMSDLDPRPFIAFVGIHSERFDRGAELLARINRAVAGVYVQITPFRPQSDTVSKLLRCADLYAHAADDFSVIAGRGGGGGNFFRALGVAATDAGLAEGETFDFASKARPKKPGDGVKGKGFGRRIYLPALGLSVSGKQFRLLGETQGLQQFARCALPCCRFNPFDTKRAVEHSLRARVAEATEQRDLPRSSAVERQLDQLASRLATLNSCNSVLAAMDEAPFSTKHLEHQSAALARRLARSTAA